ncbi:stage III sporulation protein AG [Ammoniphilus oxalaticus]|uniref:Stage III sporulation protein AG n=1 Tax=Ammoniphilus oxalaticus TaxID=66863 RepID=A0A419SMR8_9BACL|nr:stage III sporulation protein AG [Ammoniphilus oxalaticus]RKD25575.1 stage III sporulation protein AG [Ammoniphilus oxalaticus]
MGNGWFSKLKQKWGKGEEGKKRIGAVQKLIVLGAIGAAVMIFSSFQTDRQPWTATNQQPESPPDEQAVFSAKSSNKDEPSMADYEAQYVGQLKEILEEVIGVGEVSVMVNLESTEEVIVQKDTNERSQVTKEVDKERATRDIQDSSKDEKVVLVQGSQGEHPIIVKKVKPKVRGVVVVARGAENMKVKAWIHEAVQKALHVEPHKISILPKKG